MINTWINSKLEEIYESSKLLIELHTSSSLFLYSHINCDVKKIQLLYLLKEVRQH